MSRILTTYAHKFRFRHPTTADFQRIVEQVTGHSWKPYFKQFVYDGKMTDYSIDSITVNPINQGNDQLFESVVNISQIGATTSKVPILFTFKDGHTTRKIWSGEDSQVELKLQYKEPLLWAMIDPDYTLVLENKHINNFLKAEVDGTLRTRSNLGIVKLLEAVLGSFLW